MAIVFSVLAAICFAVPDISVIDILPDFIGCLLLYFAISVPSEFSSKLVEARSLLLKLFCVTGADFIISMFLSSDDPTMILLMSFCFGIAEAVMLYMISDMLFEGMVFLGTKFPATGIYMPLESKKREKYRSDVEKKFVGQKKLALDAGDEKKLSYINDTIEHIVSKKCNGKLQGLTKLTHFFIIARAALNILPEFTALSSYEVSGSVSAAAVDIYRFRGLFILFAVFISVIVSAVWLCNILKYINGIRKDTAFIDAMHLSYRTTVKTNSGLLYYRTVKIAIFFVFAAFLLSFDFTVDNINIIPDFISGAALIFFWCFFIREKNVWGITSASLYTVFSAVQWFAVKNYVNNFYDFTRTMKSEKAMNSYIICCVITFISEVMFVAALTFVFKKLHDIIYSSTGFLVKEGEHDDFSKKLHQKLDRQNKNSYILSVVCAVVSTAYMILIGINKGVEAMEDGVKYIVYVPVFESIGVVRMIVEILFLIYALKHLSDIQDGLDTRYKLD